MLGSDIQKHFDNDSFWLRHFIGVLGAEELGRVKQAEENTFAIVNVDPTTESGTHWYALFKVGTETYELFDSLGFADEHSVNKRLESLGGYEILTFNEHAVQHKESTKCGEYAVYFSACRMQNYDEDFNEVLNKSFTRDFGQNDEIVSDYWNRGIFFNVFGS